MRRLAVMMGASLMFAEAAFAGFAGNAKDGIYQAEDGEFLYVNSAKNSVGLGGVFCSKPVVRNGRIFANDCWSNGHHFDKTEGEWRVDGDVVSFDGKRFTWKTPPSTASVGVQKTPSQPPTLPGDTPSGRPWTHNGSEVMIDPETGIVAYSDPKASLRPVVKVGTVLFRGTLWPENAVKGTAYAFKEGCPPAPYPVRGRYSDHAYRLTLRGPGPVREGCEVVGYSDSSPHAVLNFSYALND